MADEEALARRLRERIQAEATYHAAPPGVAARVLASLPHDAPDSAPRRAPRRDLWRTAPLWAAACTFVLAAGLYYSRPGPEDALAAELVAGHVRSMMVDHASDVASSDRHTVKPWFAGKLDFSPPVLDLTAQGFALVGGRLDYIDRRPVAALVYRHRQHLINLFVWPAAGDGATRLRELQGFHLVRWTHEGMVFWAVSDLNSEELAQFREVLLKTPG